MTSTERAKSAEHRPLSNRERDSMLRALDYLDKLRPCLVGIAATLGTDWPREDFDNACEVVRAIVTDTHSLVRESGPPL